MKRFITYGLLFWVLVSNSSFGFDQINESIEQIESKTTSSEEVVVEEEKKQEEFYYSLLKNTQPKQSLYFLLANFEDRYIKTCYHSLHILYEAYLH